jgi:tetratricopeptide (TPR) repeat protein
MSAKTILGFSLVALMTTACASAAPPPPATGVTSMQAPDGSPAQDIQLAARPSQVTAHPLSMEVAAALGAHDYEKVFALTDVVTRAREGAWLRYDRASALAGLGRTDAAVNEFDRAELRFIENDDDAGRAMAIWGRARALAEAGRCPEARRAYDEYVGLMRSRDSDSAQMALRYAAACRSPVTLR